MRMFEEDKDDKPSDDGNKENNTTDSDKNTDEITPTSDVKEGDDETIDEKGRVMTYVSKEFLEGLGLQILSITNDPMGRDIHWINAASMK